MQERIKKDESGIASIVIMLAAVLVIAVAAGVFYLVQSQQDETEQVTDSSEIDRSNDTDRGDESAAGVESEGGYTVQRLADLAPVCENEQFPSGLSSTSSGKVTAVIGQTSPRIDSYRDLMVRADPEYRIASEEISNLTNVDRVACVNLTDTVADERACDIDGTSFSNVSYRFDVKIYDLQSRDLLLDDTIAGRTDCPRMATIVDNKHTATIDSTELGALVMSID